ncbi:MAG: class I SAM-dependent methyltransferase [Nitrospirota bacterium]
MEDLDRQKAERDFYDEFYQKGWERQDYQIDEEIVPPNMRRYWHIVRAHIEQLKSRQSVIQALDCGCGHGVLSVLLAKMDVKVAAVDISPNSIRITERLAHANGVRGNISTHVALLENLPFEENHFDCIVGTRVLHHVNIMASGRHLARVLKPHGVGIFWECTEKNAVLRFARKNVRRLMPLPKFGTQYEHPLTQDEIDALGRFFGEKVQIVDAPFYFFGFLDQYIFRQRARIITKAVNGLDTIIAQYLPFLNRYSFHQILILEKRPGENPTDGLGKGAA